MNEHAALFLASLSHGWSPLILPLPIVCGAIMYGAGKLQARTRLSGGPAHGVARAGGMLSVVLFMLSIGAAGISISHVGCAYLAGYSSQCMSDMEVLALATLTYTQDYDERLPPSTRWADAIAAQVRQANQGTSGSNGDPLVCPAAQTPASYGMNKALGCLPLGKISSPAETVLFFEANAPSRTFSGGARDVAQTRHFGASNVGFADGHVRRANAYVQQKLIWAPAPSTNHPGGPKDSR